MMAYSYATCFAIFSQIKETFYSNFPFFFHNQVERGSTPWGGSRPLKPPQRGRASYTLRHPAHAKINFGFGKWVYSSAPTITQTRSKKDVVAVARVSDHSVLPSSARSEASIFFHMQCCKIWKGRRSCCEIFQIQIALNPLQFWHAKHPRVPMTAYS